MYVVCLFNTMATKTKTPPTEEEAAATTTTKAAAMNDTKKENQVLHRSRYGCDVNKLTP